MHHAIKVLLSLIILVSSNQLLAELLRDDHPDQHVVKKGDTLWGISEAFLNDPWLWPEIWHANDQIENPHLIYPGDVIKLVYMDGKPKLVLDRGGKTSVKRRQLPDGTVKLSPRVRVSDLDSVIPAIPLDAVQSFLVDHRVIEPSLLDGAPYVLSGSDGRIILGVHDKIYARGDVDKAHTAYGVYREGIQFFDPDTNEFLGLVAEEIALAKLLDVQDDIGTLRLVRTRQDVRINDMLLPTIERKVDSTFYPKSPDVEIDGKILHVFGGVRNVSQYNVVVLNKGDRDELKVGDVLAIYRMGERIRDRNTSELVQLPAERAGILIVFRTFEKVSFGLVLKAQKTLKMFDQVRNP